MGVVKELERAPDLVLVAELEKLAQMAREGKMIGFAIMVNCPDGYYFAEEGYFANRDLLLAIEIRKRKILECFQPVD